MYGKNILLSWQKSWPWPPSQRRRGQQALSCCKWGHRSPETWGWLPGGAQPVLPAATLACQPEPRLLWRARVGPHSPASQGWPEGPECLPLLPCSPHSLVFFVPALLLGPHHPHFELCFLLSLLSACTQCSLWFQRGFQNYSQKHFVQNSKELSPRMWSFLPGSPRV